MNKKLFYRLSLNLTMFVLFIFLMAYPLTDSYIHELLGSLLFLLLIIHNLLNKKWYKTLKKGKYSLVRVFHTIINLLMVNMILFTFTSALGISHWLFYFLPFDWGWIGRDFHVLAAYWGMIIVAIHIGLHWGGLMSIIKKTIHLSQFNVWETQCLLKIVTIFMVSYGIYALFKLEIGARLILYSHFLFRDETEAVWILLFDYLAIFSLYISITYYMLKFIRK